MTKIAILGAGQIGRAVYKIITDLRENSDNRIYDNIDVFVADVSEANISKLVYGTHRLINFEECTGKEIGNILYEGKITHVINALPFFLNEKIAIAASIANANYIDFTEDDNMADKVCSILGKLDINCAVKCGLAPGFVNYIGYDLINKINTPDTLLVSVGALPRLVSYGSENPEQSYNLTWSVDGLVNEYIRPCRVKKLGVKTEIIPISEIIDVVIDGVRYEAACTSGGIGSLIDDLNHVPNIQYMTLRYPGHYAYVKSIISENNEFDSIKTIFKEKFPFTDDDVIVVYANALGKDEEGTFIRRSYFNKYYGVNGLSGIQSTTAASGVAILELMLTGKVQGIITHSNVNLKDFVETEAFKKYYSTNKS